MRGIAVALCMALAGSPAWVAAGGGPETTVIVVNADSALSMKIANHYAKLRDIPQTHLIELHEIPTLETIDVKSFRERIWEPVRRHLTVHGLADQIDTIAYSSDFPYSVNVSADIKAARLKSNKHRGNVASLTGLTFFARRVEIGDVGYLKRNANLYYRRNLAARPRSRSLNKHEIKLQKSAQRAFRKKDFPEAIEHYDALLASHPGASRAWYNLARSFAATGAIEDAIQALESAVDTGWTASLLIQSDPHLKPLRALPRFTALLERMEAGNGPFEPAHGFRSRYSWDPRTLPVPAAAPAGGLNRYYLSTLLAYTGIRGNSVPEVIRYLDSAAESDGTRPDGTVYLMKNDNIRSVTRQRYFPATVRALERRNRRAKILTRGQGGQNGIIPVGKSDVIGAVVGARNYRWQRSKSRLLPGAIAESLTSYGGHFNRGFQTKLSEFLRHGAAGSSGAVVEPFSFQEKFPVSMLHVHYADGCSLAEAFYQSVAAPYQLIIVGDPLARPYADFAKVRLDVPDPERPWRGTVAVRPSVTPAPGRPIARTELWIDGVHVAEAPPNEALSWDTRSVEDGAHEIRLVAVEAGPIETRSYVKYWIRVANSERRVRVDAVLLETTYGAELALTGSAPGAQEVLLVRGFRVLTKAPVDAETWRVTLPSARMGLGSSVVFVRVRYADGSTLRSKPISVRVREPPPHGAATRDDRYAEGMRALVTAENGDNKYMIIKSLNGELRAIKDDSRISRLRLDGEVYVQDDGFWQFAVRSRGRLRVRLADHDSGEKRLTTKTPEVLLPMSLQAGWHRLSIELIPEGPPSLKVVAAGEQIAQILSAKTLRHVWSIHPGLNIVTR